MKVSQNWLKELVDINTNPDDLSEKLSMGGFEVESLINCSKNVEGIVTLKICKGLVEVIGRESAKSLYSQDHVTFEEDSVYDQRDAAGFIKLNALRLKIGSRLK